MQPAVQNTTVCHGALRQPMRRRIVLLRRVLSHAVLACVLHVQYLKSIRLERNRKTGFKCPRGCGKGTKHPGPCPGKIDKSHPIHPRNEEQKKKKKVGNLSSRCSRPALRTVMMYCQGPAAVSETTCFGCKVNCTTAACMFPNRAHIVQLATPGSVWHIFQLRMRH